MGRWVKGKFIPKHPEKYIGPDLDNIIYRSSWEKHAFEFFDSNQYILAWASEPFPIQYMKPMLKKDGSVYLKPSKYYPDIYVEYVDIDKKFHKELIEIKPYKQTKPSRSRKPLNKLMENQTYQINMAKWNAAKKWCDDNDIEFKIHTEKTLFS